MSDNIKTKTLKIDGMTCINCENKIRTKLKSTLGIINAKVSYTYSTAIITYDSSIIRLNEIVGIIEHLDYKVLTNEMKSNQASDQNAGRRNGQKTGNPQTQKLGDKPNYTKLLGVIIIIFAIYMVTKMFGGLNVFNVFPQAELGMSYGMLFIIGILTSIHCVAMCGGINLSQCVPQKQPASLTKSGASTIAPSLLYNAGRVISYTVVGGFVGAVGSVVSFSGPAKGLVQLAAGIFMVIMGLNMLNIFPWLRRFNLHMPKIFATKINEQKIHKGPLVVGLLNGLMPCGPLQAMQLYALSTGDPVKGAMSMFIFSLGTVPLMFGLGALSTLLSKKFTSKMMTASAVLVVILGVFMFSSGMSLSGIRLPSFNASAKNSSTNVNAAKTENGVQVVTTGLPSGRYEPITVQKGVPVKWIIQARDGEINGCNNRIVIPEFNKEKALEVGDNIIEFTPTESGTFGYSCWMGMIRSKITVVDNLNPTGTSDSNPSAGSSYKIPTENIAIADLKDGKQTVNIDMDDKSFSPAVIVMQKGLSTSWIINGKTITESNRSLYFSLYETQLNMKEGENNINFNPDADFCFSAIDSSFYGYVKVVDDISKIDLEAIRNEVSTFVPTEQEVVDNTGLPACH